MEIKNRAAILYGDRTQEHINAEHFAANVKKNEIKSKVFCDLLQSE